MLLASIDTIQIVDNFKKLSRFGEKTNQFYCFSHFLSE